MHLEYSARISHLSKSKGDFVSAVAIQCLESVYEVGPDDIAALAVRETLPNMFRAATENERVSFARKIRCIVFFRFSFLGMKIFSTFASSPQGCFKGYTTSKANEAPKKEPHPEAEEAKQRGNDLLKAEKYLEALEMYSKAIDLDPHNAVYFCNRAAAFSKLEKSQEAIADCEAALAIDPTYSKAYGRMGIAYAASGDHQRALECYQKALRHDPTNESYQNNVRVAQEQIRVSQILSPGAWRGPELV